MVGVVAQALQQLGGGGLQLVGHAGGGAVRRSSARSSSQQSGQCPALVANTAHQQVDGLDFVGALVNHSDTAVAQHLFNAPIRARSRGRQTHGQSLPPWKAGR